jgi:F-type H+-transporting ATPase subunit epsilon
VPLELCIVTPQGPVYEDRVETVVIPGEEGDFGVLPGHERFLAPVRIGELTLRSDQVHYAAISAGFADVSGDRVTLLVDACELAPDIDEARAERARARAEQELERLRADRAETSQYRLTHAALDRALVRLAVAKKG